MADIAKINGYNVKDAESRERLSTLENVSSTFEKNLLGLTQQVEDLYTLGEQGGLFTVTTVEDTYTTRETAGGNLNIADGVSTIVQTIEGSTVRCDNLIVYPYFNTTKTVNGGRFTDNGDGSITINGTFTAQTDFLMCDGNNPPSATLTAGQSYTLSGCPTGGGSDKYMLTYSGNPIGLWHDYGSGITFTPTDNVTPYNLRIRIAEGFTANNLIFRPMLNVGTTALSYQPYFKGLKNAYFKEIVSTGRNLIPYPYKETTKTTNGITFTDNGDGSLTVNGTAEGGIASFTFSSASNSINFIAGKTYYFSCPHGVLAYQEKQGGEVRYRTAFPITWGEGWIFVSLYMQLNNGESENNLTLYPMLNFGTTAEPYEPYKQSVLSLPEALENPVYNTLNFQTGKNISQGITKVFDGTETWRSYSTADYYIYTTSIPIYGFSQSEGVANKDFTFITPNVTNPKGCYIAGNSNNTFNVWFKVSEYPEFDTVDNWKAWLTAQSSAGDPFTVRYKTAEVQSEADLNASSDRYIAWKGGSETIVQGEVDNSEYGAENTVTQEYFTITGGTTNES